MAMATNLYYHCWFGGAGLQEMVGAGSLKPPWLLFTWKRTENLEVVSG
jgi:hypothetical protein